jgi:hypothetical protein
MERRLDDENTAGWCHNARHLLKETCPVGNLVNDIECDDEVNALNERLVM